MNRYPKILTAMCVSLVLISLSRCIDDAADDGTDIQPPSGGTPVVGTCTFAGDTYQIGERFEAGDGCNRCSCEEGGAVACTEIGCTATMELCTLEECGPTAFTMKDPESVRVRRTACVAIPS